jgi:methylenetetrahydrofolate reductase (NADPH)
MLIIKLILYWSSGLSGETFRITIAIIRFKRLKAKVDAGADYVVTQMFFDNAKYFEFVAKAREMGIMVPIIPGIKPLAVQRHLQILPQIFRIDLPEDLIQP